MILGIVVTYNPNIDELEDNLIQIKEEVNKCVIFDNNSNNSQQVKILSEKLGIQLISNEENVGLGKAYNEVLKLYHCKYFITFDQDTYIPRGTVSLLKKALEKDSQIGLIGPMFSRNESIIYESGDLVYKTAIIQSCALIKRDIYDKVGIFNEDYFIDSVDFEFCLRVILKNYKVAIYKGVKIKHQLGINKKFINLINYSEHSEKRVYYMARNHFDISYNYLKFFPFFVLKKNYFFFQDFLKLILFEFNLRKLKYLFTGLFDSFLKNIK